MRIRFKAGPGDHPVSELLDDLPSVGPSVVALMLVCDRLWTALPENEEAVEISTGELARLLGLGTATGSDSPVARTVKRATLFGLAQLDGETLTMTPGPARRRRNPR